MAEASNRHFCRTAVELNVAHVRQSRPYRCHGVARVLTTCYGVPFSLGNGRSGCGVPSGRAERGERERREGECLLGMRGHVGDARGQARNLVFRGPLQRVLGSVTECFGFSHSLCRANSAQTRQSRPDSDLGLVHFQHESL